MGDGDDGNTGLLPLSLKGPGFSFYGASFDRIAICTNGWLSFTDSTCEGGDITLWRGKDNTIGCNIHADASSVAGRVQKIITVTADYDYITDAQTSVTVTGQSSNSNGFIS